jgi:hypothetical protein
MSCLGLLLLLFAVQCCFFLLFSPSVLSAPRPCCFALLLWLIGWFDQRRIFKNQFLLLVFEI